jgi:HEPN domain-containing protein
MKNKHQQIIDHWIEGANKDYKTMMDLYNTQNFNWSLFIGHLVIEKLLKALYIKKTESFPPLIHDLRRICEKAGIELSEEKIIYLDTITRFNINARYDDYKQSFYNLCTENFTVDWINNIKNIRIWIKQMLSD